MTSNKRHHHNLFVFALLLSACDPEAKNLGEDLSADEGDWSVDWRLESALQGIFYDIEPTIDGGVVLVGADTDVDRRFLRRYAADGTLAWSTEPQIVSGAHLATTASAIFLAGDSMAEASRARLQRLSLEGQLEYAYTHPREGDSNAFSFDVAASADEVAVVIGNYGGAAYPGEPWFEVQRLDHELQPIGEALPFENRVEQIAYDASGELVILEVPEDGLARVHRPLSEAEPALVDCDSLLTSSGAPLCVNALPDFRVTNYETGAEQDLGSLGFEEVVGLSSAVGLASTLFAAARVGDGLLEVVEVMEDGEVGRRIDLPLSPSGVGGVGVSLRQLPDGAAYAVAIEVMEGPPCPNAQGNCFRSHLLRLAAD